MEVEGSLAVAGASPCAPTRNERKGTLEGYSSPTPFFLLWRARRSIWSQIRGRFSHGLRLLSRSESASRALPRPCGTLRIPCGVPHRNGGATWFQQSVPTQVGTPGEQER